MESDRIERMLEKYFEGETSIAEETELQNYFSSPDVSPHLEHHKPMFAYFSTAKEQKGNLEMARPSVHQFQFNRKSKNRLGLSIAASIAVLIGIGIYVYNENENGNQDLGTYDNPEVAFRETQKALTLLSNNVNVGIKSVRYVEEYQHSKELIFKQ